MKAEDIKGIIQRLDREIEKARFENNKSKYYDLMRIRFGATFGKTPRSRRYNSLTVLDRERARQ